MQINSTNPYSGYSRSRQHAMAYGSASALHAQAEQENATARYQDRVSLTGVGENLAGFFTAGAELLPGETPEAVLVKNVAGVKNHLLTVLQQLDIAENTRLEIKNIAVDGGAEWLLSGVVDVEQAERLTASLNADSLFRHRFSAAEQMKQLSTGIATARLRMQTMAEEGHLPQYQDLQKIKDEVEQQQLRLTLADTQLGLELID